MDFTGLVNFLTDMFGDLRKVISSLMGAVAIVVGTIQNLGGAVNTLLVNLINLVADVWPSTPDEIKLATLIENAGNSTGIGTAIIYDTFQTAFLVLSIVALVKLYKLIPFKMT